MSRFVYWTILLDGVPTAFRGQTRDELLPTLKQLQRRHPGAVLKWHARGRLWDSPEDARRPPIKRRPPKPINKRTGFSRAPKRQR